MRRQTQSDKSRTNFKPIATIAIVLLLVLAMIATNFNLYVNFPEQGLTEDRIQDELDHTWRSWMERAMDLAHTVRTQDLPTTTRPFIFFHNRKAAGSSLRSIIYNSAKASRLKAFVPCSDRPCVPYSLPPNNEVYDVYASHLNYVHMIQVSREIGKFREKTAREKVHHVSLDNNRSADAYSVDDDQDHFQCLTNLRPTVSRVVSCWNFRFTTDVSKVPQTWNLPHSYDMTASDWETLLPFAYDKYSNGCNNEIVRIFGSTQDETEVNLLTSKNESSLPGLAHEFGKIASRLSKCVIVLPLRCEESNVVLRHYLPWLKDADLCHKANNVNKSTKGRNALKGNSSDVILKHNHMDELLYRFGEALFEEQFKIANASLHQD